MLQVDDLLEIINRREATSWSAAGPMTGGTQQGAYRLRGREGQSAVLKVYVRDLPASGLHPTATSIERARQRGWPSPKWLAFGPLPGDQTYVIEEFVEGATATELDSTRLDQLIRASSCQIGLAPESDQDWSAYIHSVVFDDAADLASRMHARTATAEVQRRLERATASSRDQRMPTADLVHGDFVLRNMLIRDGELHVIDAGYAGKGTRTYDLVSLLVETSVDGQWADRTGADARRLLGECLATADPATVLLCVAARIMHLLVFGDRWRENDPAPAARRCMTFLDELERITSRR